MNTTKLECKTYSPNIKLFLLLIVLYLASMVFLVITLYPGNNSSSAQSDMFVLEIVLLMLVLFLFPIFISNVKHNFNITSKEIFQKKSYLFGLIQFSLVIPWNKVKSWDSSIFFNPMMPQQIPQIKIFLIKGFFRFDKLNKNFSRNDEPTDWDHFNRELESLLSSVGIPQKTPEPVQAQTRLLKKSFLITTIVLGILILFGCILSVVVGKISYSLIYAGVMFSILFAGASTQIFKKK